MKFTYIINHNYTTNKNKKEDIKSNGLFFFFGGGKYQTSTCLTGAGPKVYLPINGGMNTS